MNTNNFFLVVILLLSGLSSTAQQTYTYNFGGNFSESSGNGPALTKICTGKFETENLPDYSMNRQIYHFDENCGFSFNDAGGFLASGSYTIELYFKLKDLSAWRRVIDFKDRGSDQGCYVFNGQMNFYNIVTSSTAPFHANAYSHYVITRNAATKKVVMYGNGNSYISFTDNGNDAIYNASNKKLNFFQDDLSIGGEASEGSIAVLKISNYAKDTSAVKTSYNNLSGTLTGINKVSASAITAGIYPNPAGNFVTIANLQGNSAVRISDITGKVVYSSVIKTEQTTINTSEFGNGIYILHISNNGSFATRKLVVNR